MLRFEGFRTDRTGWPWRVEGAGISLEVVKKAEKEECLVLRLVETLGGRSRGRLICEKSGGLEPMQAETAHGASLIETDLMEWQDGRAIPMDGAIALELQPFEIRTYKLREPS